MLEITPELVLGVWDHVGREPGAAEAELAVEFPDERLHLRIFRGDFEDILANLLRNALEASAAVGESALAVRVECEEDEITGVENTAIRIADRAPNRLSTAVIRSRYIERGLGLAVDLVSRNGGSVHVESEPGFTKAIVVRLPRVERVEEVA